MTQVIIVSAIVRDKREGVVRIHRPGMRPCVLYMTNRTQWDTFQSHSCTNSEVQGGHTFHCLPQGGYRGLEFIQ